MKISDQSTIEQKYRSSAASDEELQNKGQDDELHGGREREPISCRRADEYEGNPPCVPQPGTLDREIWKGFVVERYVFFKAMHLSVVGLCYSKVAVNKMSNGEKAKNRTCTGRKEDESNQDI